MSATSYIRACERSLEDWEAAEWRHLQPKQRNDDCGSARTLTREALLRAYLLARQAVEAAERGPTHVSVDTAVVSPEARNDFPPAFAETLEPEGNKAKRSA